MTDYGECWYQEDSERQCCKDATIVIYSRNMVTSHCYEGTRDTWESVYPKGYFRLTDCVLIIGPLSITDT